MNALFVLLAPTVCMGRSVASALPGTFARSGNGRVLRTSPLRHTPTSNSCTSCRVWMEGRVIQATTALEAHRIPFPAETILFEQTLTGIVPAAVGLVRRDTSATRAIRSPSLAMQGSTVPATIKNSSVPSGRTNQRPRRSETSNNPSIIVSIALQVTSATPLLLLPMSVGLVHQLTSA